jgi:hypothetical protein
MYKKGIATFENGLVVGNGGQVRPPSTYKVSTGDIDVDTSRSTSGYLNRNRVRGGSSAVYTLEMSWDRLDWDELVLLIGAGEAPKFTMTFLDPKTAGGYTTKTMYREANMSYELSKIYSDEEAYWKATMTFVEY